MEYCLTIFFFIESRKQLYYLGWMFPDDVVIYELVFIQELSVHTYF